MLETILEASFTVNVLLLCMCVVLWSRMTDAENAERTRTKELSDTRAKVRAASDDLSHEMAKRLRDTGELQKRIAGLQAELDKEKDKQKDASPWARDLPTSQRFEVVRVPCEAVTLRSALDVPPPDLVDLTKVDLISRLRAEVLQQAAEYVEVMKDCYDPCRMTERFIATLRVYKRRDGG